MKIGKIDNTTGSDFTKVIIWQYDKAPRLIGLINIIKTIFDTCIKEPWDRFLDSTINLDNLSEYSTTLWGLNIGLNHPIYKTTVDGETVDTPISFDYYGRLVSGWVYLMSSSYSMYDITKFLQKVYGDRITVRDHNDDQNIPNMCLSFTANESAMTEEEKYLLQNNIDLALARPAGVNAVFNFSTQQ